MYTWVDMYFRLLLFLDFAEFEIFRTGFLVLPLVLKKKGKIVIMLLFNFMIMIFNSFSMLYQTFSSIENFLLSRFLVEYICVEIHFLGNKPESPDNT